MVGTAIRIFDNISTGNDFFIANTLQKKMFSVIQCHPILTERIFVDFFYSF